jgi:thiol-disulfide isomerase/thioredoxin
LTVFIGARNDSITIGIDLNQNNVFEKNEINQMPERNKTIVSYNIFPKVYCNIKYLVDSSVIHLVPFVNQVHYSDMSASDSMLQLSYSIGFVRRFKINDTLEIESHSSSLKKRDSSFIFKYIEETPSGIFALYTDRDLLPIKSNYYSFVKKINKDTLYLLLRKENPSKTVIDGVSKDVLNSLNPLDLTTNKPTIIQFEKQLILLDFWATYCLPCIQAMPHLQELNVKFGSKCQILSFCVDASRNLNKARELSGKYILKFKHYFLPDVKKTHDSLTEYLGVIEYPTYILLNKSGDILQIVNNISELNLRKYYYPSK